MAHVKLFTELLEIVAMETEDRKDQIIRTAAADGRHIVAIHEEKIIGAIRRPPGMYVLMRVGDLDNDKPVEF